MTSVASGVPMISCGVMRSRTGHDRERIAVDQVPRSSDAHAQAARDLGEQARDNKLRQSDPEPAHAEREQRQARPPPRDSGGRPSEHWSWVSRRPRRPSPHREPSCYYH